MIGITWTGIPGPSRPFTFFTSSPLTHAVSSSLYEAPSPGSLICYPPSSCGISSATYLPAYRCLVINSPTCLNIML